MSVIKLNEKVNLDKLRIIVDNVEELYKSGAIGKFKDKANGYKEIKDLKTISTILNKSYAFYKSGISQHYSFVKDIEYGRLFSQHGGLQSFSRKLRGTVAKGLYWDLDIVNCHPQLVRHWCDDNEVPCPVLSAYIENRDPFLKELMAYNTHYDRDDAKTVPLVLLNNGPVYCDCPQWVNDFKEEMAGIHDAFVSKRVNKMFVDRATKRNPDNIKGSALNYWLCKTENEILQCIIEKVSETYEIGVLCFDGLMIYISEQEIDIPAIENYIYEKTGYTMSLKIKDFDEEIDLTGFAPKLSIVEELLSCLDIDQTFTDLAVCDVFHKFYKDSLYHEEKDSWIQYNPVSGVWEYCDTDSILYPFMKLMNQEFTKYVNELKPEKPDDKDSVKAFKEKQKSLMREANKLGTSTFANRVIKSCKPLFYHPDVLVKFDSHKNLFCFSNKKAYDVETGEVLDITKEMMVMTTCGYAYSEPNEDNMNEVMAFIRDIQYESEVDYFLSLFATGLYAGNRGQNFFVHTGRGGNGKSLMNLLFRRTLGNYAETLNVEQLTMPVNGQDSANSGLCRLRGKRIAISNEPADSESSKLKLQTDRIKNFSGDPEIIARDLHKTAKRIMITWTHHLLCNDIPVLSRPDGGIQRRLKIVNYPYKFVDNPSLDNEKKRNYDLEKKFERAKNLHIAFFHVLAGVYRKCNGLFIPSDTMKNATEEYFAEQNPLYEFLKHCKKTDSKFVRQNDVLLLFQKFSKNMGDSKLLVHERSIRKYLELGGVVIVDDKSNGNKVYLDVKDVAVEALKMMGVEVLTLQNGQVSYKTQYNITDEHKKVIGLAKLPVP